LVSFLAWTLHYLKQIFRLPSQQRMVLNDLASLTVEAILP